ncbi:putative baseplate assembly protein [Nocardia sp. NPDC019219]|uniref:putative baseplate assembly protein n=1 Tax=Nocardia sp. NPDC019219 TaxID=3154590 RepID=UPI0033D4EAE4
MTRTEQPLVDARDAAAFVAAMLARRSGYVPEWQPGPDGPDVALTEIVGRYLAAITARLNQIPDKHQLAMLDALGVPLVPARAARALVVFSVGADTGNIRVPAGTRLAATPPEPVPTNIGPAEPADSPMTTPPQPVNFETERSIGLTSGRLVEVRSHWPGRDQSIDHTAAITAGEPFRPWRPADLQDIPHHLYLAHSTLLAISATSHVAVEFELSQGSSEELGTVWEYWDGKVWRPFRNTIAACDRTAAAQEDSTARFQQSGTIHLLTDCAETTPATVAGIESFWVRGRLTEPLPPNPAQLLPEIKQIRLSTTTIRRVQIVPPIAGVSTTLAGGFLPDTAIVAGAEVDTSALFYPFGPAPQPGSIFYFSSEEAFTKPRAHLDVCFTRTRTPQDELSDGDSLPHLVAWEYWNGREWARVPNFTADLRSAPADLDPTDPAKASVSVSLTVPEDIAPTKVADIEARWMRVRLVSGGFGVRQEVTWTDSAGNSNTFSYIVSKPPALSEFKLGYTWTHGPFTPERVLTYNDFRYADRTDEAIWPGRIFRPFTPPVDLTPALYLGFDKPLPADEVGILIDIAEDPTDSRGPTLVWEYWDGGSWRPVRVEDGTRGLRLPGLVSLIGPRNSVPLDRFGSPRSWLRARLAEDGPPGEPTIRAIFPNATWAVQQQTILDDPIGAGTGLPDQVLVMRQVPVLPGEQIEVRELAGSRAGVEWRIVALELFGGDQRAVREIEGLLGQESTRDIVYGPLRLRRDRAKQVTEVWVRWYPVEHLVRSGPNDRHYALEPSRGRLQFGDGATGKAPPAGAAILARRYQTGGGSIGNVAAGAISQLQASIGGVEAVTNPMPAEGGADGETLDALRVRGPQTLRHRGRGLSVTDLVTLAREASPAVAVATALAGRSADGRRRPGYVTLIVIPATADPRPFPSFGLREQVRRYVEARAEATLAALGRIEVTGPQYLPIDVEVTVVPHDPAEAGPVEKRATAALTRLLHPVHGGPDGSGWPPGRTVYLADVAAVLERVDGVDFVEQLTISTGGQIGGERIAVAPHRTVVAGELRIRPARAEG